jgi:hypothetical protein
MIEAYLFSLILDKEGFKLKYLSEAESDESQMQKQ